MKKLTPVVSVQEIESCLPFWERLGFERSNEVPEGDRLGFVTLSRGGVEIMYQTVASLEQDLPELAKRALEGFGLFFVEVSSLDLVRGQMPDAEEVVPERETFYGSKEIVVRAPCGSVVIFAEFTASEGS